MYTKGFGQAWKNWPKISDERSSAHQSAAANAAHYGSRRRNRLAYLGRISEESKCAVDRPAQKGGNTMRRYEATFQMIVPEPEKDANIFTLSNLSTDDLLGSSIGEELRVAGDRLLLSCNRPDRETAKKWAGETAERFARALSLRTGQHFTPVFQGLDSVPGEPGQSILAPLAIRFWVETYDPKNFSKDLELSGRGSAVTDQKLHKATTYFRRGVFYRRVVWRLVHPNMSESAFNVGEATLNFYKAVEVILGGDRQWAGRARNLGIDRILKNRIRKLYARRDKRDVAHASLDPSALKELEDTVSFSQDVARQVIEAYIGFLYAERAT